MGDYDTIIGLSTLLGGILFIGWFYWVLFVSFTGYWSFVFGLVSSGVQFLIGVVLATVTGIAPFLPYVAGIVAIELLLSAVRGYAREGERIVVGTRTVLDPGLHFVWFPFSRTHRVPKETTVRKSIEGVRAADGTAVITTYELKYLVDDAAALVRTFGSGYDSEIRLIADQTIREVIGDRAPTEIAPDDSELISQIERTIETKVSDEANTQEVITVAYVELVMPNIHSVQE